MDRRNFIKKVGVGAAGLAAAGALGHSKALAKKGKRFNWKMTTCFPPKYPIIQPACERFAKRVGIMSDGQLKIQVFGAGELIPAMETFEAVRQGTAIKVGGSASYYWSGKIPEASFFAAFPFGFTARETYAWLFHGGGLKLWRDLYGEYNLVPFPFLNTGVQMGGWFRKEINSISDLKGLKMRVPGLGGKVYAKAGVNVVLLPIAEIYPALERGVIDACEWATPFLDIRSGFHRVAKYYYYPGWQEPGTNAEIIINKKAWESLPQHLQVIVETAAHESIIWSTAEFDTRNAEALNKIISEKKVEMRKFPDDVLKLLKKISRETMAEEAAKNPRYKKIYESAKNFQKKITNWSKIGEQAIYHAASL